MVRFTNSTLKIITVIKHSNFTNLNLSISSQSVQITEMLVIQTFYVQFFYKTLYTSRS